MLPSQALWLQDMCSTGINITALHFHKIYLVYHIFITINRYYLTVLHQSVCIIMQNGNYEAENNSLHKIEKFSDLKLFIWK